MCSLSFSLAFDVKRFIFRINFESHGIDQKVYLNAIGACLNDSEVFTGDAIRDALSKLVDDPVMSKVLARTALIAGQTHQDVKRYILNDFLPAMIRRKIWSTAPLQWKGVVMCIKKFVLKGYAQSAIEPTLRAVFGLPGPQLKATLAESEDLKGHLVKLLKTLSPAEREEVTSGRWVGIAPTVAEGDEPIPMDSEKTRIVSELTALSTAP